MASGYDVWEGRPFLPPADFLILRCDSGYRPDTAFAGLYAAAKGRYRYGRGVYGYAVGSNIVGQLERVAAAIADDPPELGVFGDFEDDTLSPQACEQYLGGLDALMPGRAGFYSNLSQLFTFGLVNRPEPWWAANPDGDPLPRPALFSQTGTPFVPQFGTTIDADWWDDASIRKWVGIHPAPPITLDEEDPLISLYVLNGDSVRSAMVDARGNTIHRWWNGSAWVREVLMGPDSTATVKTPAMVGSAKAFAGGFGGGGVGGSGRVDVFAESADGAGHQLHAYWSAAAGWLTDEQP